MFDESDIDPHGGPRSCHGSSADVSAETPTLADWVALLPDEVLEKELATHAAQLAVAECRFCVMVAAVDARGFWVDQGAQSCAHWLSWRCGMSPSMAREHVRVGRALRDLPVVRSAFASGRLSYSKVRAITRIATPAFEKLLADMADYATAAQLERIVRAFRRASPDEGTAALSRHQRRQLHTAVDDDGMVLLTARLSPEDGATVIAAIEAMREVLERDGGGEVGDAPTDVSAETPTDPAAATRVDALVALCERARADDTAQAATPYGSHATVVVHVDDQVLEDPAAEGCAHIEGAGAISAHTVQRLACGARTTTLRFRHDGTVVPEGKTRQVPLSLRRAVLVRDGGCRWPGCLRHRYVDVHHVTFVSAGGRTRCTNLVTLCRAHHRLVHEGGYALSMDRQSVVRVLDPAGTEIPAAPPLPPAPTADPLPALGLDDTTMSTGGDPLDLALTVDVLLAAASYPPTAWTPPST